jgi:nucleotide-binding universal stress UspA family protein
MVWQAATGPGSLSAAVLEAAAKARLADTVRVTLNGGGTVAGSHLRGGALAQQILEVAGRLQPRVIVTGARGGGALQRLFHDSVSEAVIRASEFPVLVVPNGASTWPPRRVVIGDDGSPNSESVITAAAWFAGLLELPVRLVAVRSAQGASISDVTLLEHLATLGDVAGKAAEVVTPVGEPADGIMVAAGSDALIVVGRRWPGGAGAWKTRVSTTLLHEHRGPCLIVPRPLSEAVH